MSDTKTRPGRVAITEYLEVDLRTERWHCRRCNHDIEAARNNYKEGLLVAQRDPREVHRPLINENRYEYTFAPDPEWCQRFLQRLPPREVPVAVGRGGGTHAK